MKNERNLVKMAKTDKQAFMELYDYYFPKLYAYTMVRIKNKEATEDIVQQTFLKAIENLDSFKWRAKFGSWLYQITRNLIVDHYRKDNPLVVSDLDFIESLSELTESADAELIDRQDEEEKRTKYRLIIEKMETLSNDEKELIHLKYFSQLSYQEIALIINKKPKTLAVVLHRALQKLRKELNV